MGIQNYQKIRDNFRSRWYDEQTNTNIQFRMCLFLVLYHLIICFLEIFKAKKFGMHFWGVNFWSRDFWGFVRSPRDFVLVLFFAPIHLKSGVSPGLLPDYHMQST